MSEKTVSVAPQLRRRAIDAAESKLNAKTKRDAAERLGQMFAYIEALQLVVRKGDSEPGIAPGVGYDDGRGLAEIIRFVGDINAKHLGFQ